MKHQTLAEKISKARLELVIGLETHIRLNTKTKLFCACPNQEVELPNENICSICTGQMGVLPSPNQDAVRKAIVLGKALQSSMKNTFIAWDRKHYDYPDQPKNFQLTQFHYPIIQHGTVSCYRNDGSQFTVSIKQAHIEEDAAKLLHQKDHTLVDFNKSGTPLIEVVTEPCIRAIQDVSVYAQYLQRIVQNLGISQANMEKGEFKSDVSVSLRAQGTKELNPRTEIKNLNSFKFMVEAILEEVAKQFAYYEAHLSFRPDQTTVLWNEELKQTRTMRQKEFATDYRYVLEPDIPLVDIQQEVDNTTIDSHLLPFAIETRMISGGVRPQDAKFFTANPIRAKVFLDLLNEVGNALFVAKVLTNTLGPEEYDTIPIEVLKDIITKYHQQTITQQTMQGALRELVHNQAFDYLQYFKQHTVSKATIESAIAQAIAKHPELANDIKEGNPNKAGVLVGVVIKQIGKGVSGGRVRKMIIEHLSKHTIQENSFQDGQERAASIKQSLQEDSAETRLSPEEIQQLVKEKYYTHMVRDISEETLGQKVCIAGWLASVRDHGELVFIDLRDPRYETIQLRVERKHMPEIDNIAKLRSESVLMVSGPVVGREKDDYNPNIRTGTIEVNVLSLEVLNSSKQLPFELHRASRTNEHMRLSHKYLDHRSREARKSIINRHKVIKQIRDLLDSEKFVEVETPILTAGTDEGAREFIVPSRLFPSSFYTLPQAPQQFKQMLMIGGFEKYFQIARCFRDEDSRGDRQPEFTQLDIEMSFPQMKDIVDLNTRILQNVHKNVYAKTWKLLPFVTLEYEEAMEKYGTDRPDVRFGLTMRDITHIVKGTSFQVFARPIERGGIVKCIRVKMEEQKERISKGQIEMLTTLAQGNGLGGLAYIFINEGGLQSPIIKFLGENIARKIIRQMEAQVGDIVFLSAAERKTANKALCAVRLALGSQLRLIPEGELHPVWVVHFPLFEQTEDGGWTFSHNPFSMPKPSDIAKHIRGEDIAHIISQQYDLVLNGHEIAGGSIRAHRPEILEATYRNMGYDMAAMRRSVGCLYDALHYGAPPHGGIAWGIDRLLMILEKRSSIREVIAFPKTGAGEDLLFGSPSQLSDKKISEMHIRAVVDGKGK